MSPFSKKTSFDSSKCVPLLENTLKRLDHLKKKRLTIVRQSREDVAQLLRRSQDASAATRVEHVFREENIAGAYEILEQHCRLVINGIKSLRPEKECSLELKEAIGSLIYATPRCGDLLELQKVRDLFTSRYGQDFVTGVLELRPECPVNAQIVQKLSSRPPNSDTRLKLLKEISQEYKIDWNYQRAVAASFKNGEASENSKVSPAASQISKADLPVSNEQPINSDKAIPKEPAATVTSQTAIPLRASDIKHYSKYSTASQPSNLSGHGIDKDRTRSQASSAGQNSNMHLPSHDIGRERDAKVVKESNSFDKPAHQDTLKEKTSVAVHNYALSARDSSQHRKRDSVDAVQLPPVDKVKPSAFYDHQDNDLKGHPNLGKISASPPPNLLAAQKRRPGSRGQDFDGLDAGLPPTVTQASEFEQHEMERANIASHSALDNRALPLKSKLRPIQLSDARVSRSPGNMSEPIQKAPSPPAFYQAKVFSSKPEPYSSAHYRTDGSEETQHHERAHQSYVKVEREIGSEETKHHGRAHQSYVKVERERSDKDSRRKHLPGADCDQQRGAWDSKVHLSSSNSSNDAESITAKSQKDYRHFHQQGQDNKEPYKAVGGEQTNTIFKDHARAQSKHTQHQTLYKADIHERSKEREVEVRTASRTNARHEQLEKLSEHEKHAAVLAGSNTRPKRSVVSELRSWKVEVDEDLADLETVIASAARAADAAIDIVRTSSMRSRSGRNGAQQWDHKSQARKSYGRIDAEIGFASKQTSDGTPSHHGDRFHAYSKSKGNRDHKQLYQEQEPVSFDSDVPHFDDFSSDESSTEDSPLRHDDSYAEHSSRRRVFGVDKEINTKFANDHVDEGALRWQGTAARSTEAGYVGKKNWAAGSVKRPEETYMHQEGIDTQSAGVRSHVVSRRSVRS